MDALVTYKHSLDSLGQIAQLHSSSLNYRAAHPPMDMSRHSSILTVEQPINSPRQEAHPSLDGLRMNGLSVCVHSVSLDAYKSVSWKLWTPAGESNWRDCRWGQVRRESNLVHI